MKIRNGFVSNSSSSSFIIGLAIIKDRELFDNWVSSNKINDIKIIKISELKNDWDISISDNDICLSTFTCSSVNTKYDNIDDYVAIVDICNNEGDESFGEDGDEYDIDESFFIQEQQEILNGFNESNGLTNIDITYGAGRNG